MSTSRVLERAYVCHGASHRFSSPRDRHERLADGQRRIFGRALFRIAKHVLFIDHKVKESAVAGVLIIAMVAAGDMSTPARLCARWRWG